MVKRQVSDEVLRTDADIAREQALEMEGRKIDGGGRILERRLIEIACAQEADGAAHAAPIRVVLVEGKYIGHGRNMGPGAGFCDPFLAQVRWRFHGPAAARFSGPG